MRDRWSGASEREMNKKVKEKDWELRTTIDSIIRAKRISTHVDVKVPYKYELLECADIPSEIPKGNPIGYETDILIREDLPNGRWKPRVIVELKINSVNTHGSITYSEKAYAHKSVFPYLRYGIVIGNHEGPIPWRLHRHGMNFDFMMVISAFKPTKAEVAKLSRILASEIEASRQIERIVYKQDALDCRALHRKLCLD
jgi:hypothetical protein